MRVFGYIRQSIVVIAGTGDTLGECLLDVKSQLNPGSWAKVSVSGTHSWEGSIDAFNHSETPLSTRKISPMVEQGTSLSHGLHPQQTVSVCIFRAAVVGECQLIFTSCTS